MPPMGIHFSKSFTPGIVISFWTSTSKASVLLSVFSYLVIFLIFSSNDLNLLYFFQATPFELNKWFFKFPERI